MTIGGRMRLAVWGVWGLIFLFLAMSISAHAYTSAEFVGNWVNLDAGTGGITRVEIGIFKTSFTVQTWEACVPKDCDWGTVTVPIPIKLVDSFGVSYTESFGTRILTLRLLSEELLKVHLLTDYTPEDGRRDTEADYYFSRSGSEVPLPDLTITAIWVDKPLIVYQASPTSFVRFTVKNLGPGMVVAQPFPVKVVNATRSGEEFVWTGFVQITDLPLLPGQSTEAKLAVGHSAAWPEGCYTLQLKVDPDGLIDEASERNNVSSKISFDVAQEQYLAGTIRYNDKPLPDYTTLTPSETYVMDLGPNDDPTDYSFYYNPQTGHYLFSELPDSKLRFFIYFRDSHPTGLLPGDYWRWIDLDMTTLTEEEAGSYDLHLFAVTHLLTPWDNRQLHGPDLHTHCPRTEITWEPVDGAVEYLVAVYSWRDEEHPDGGGYVDQVVFTRIQETSYVLDLPPLPDLMHYELLVGAFSATNNLSYYGQVYQDGSSRSTYEFKVCPSCVRADVSQDCRVNMLDLAILAEEWLMDTR
ncbi:MAG: hypothetical protein GX455_08365 [Phycisphaerae bacterium]|nr:hypothetical protein [Phycisphaerae bacterium]